MQLRRLKPDPLNLTVNTVVGKRMKEHMMFYKRSPWPVDAFLF